MKHEMHCLNERCIILGDQIGVCKKRYIATNKRQHYRFIVLILKATAQNLSYDANGAPDTRMEVYKLASSWSAYPLNLVMGNLMADI